MNLPHPRYEPVFNFGHVITAGSFVLTLFGLAWWQSDFQTSTKLRLDAGDAVRVQYVPIVNELKERQEANIEKLKAIDMALKDLQQRLATVSTELGLIHGRLSAIEAEVKVMNNRNGQRRAP